MTARVTARGTTRETACGSLHAQRFFAKEFADDVWPVLGCFMNSMSCHET
jgi:hypothetical protein